MNNDKLVSALQEVPNKPNVWKVAPIDQEPSVMLLNWTIKRMMEGNFFVGDHIGALGRVSTNIVQYDENNKRGITESGRIYQLVGSEGYSVNGEYTWNHYKQVNGLTELNNDAE